MFYLKKASLP